MAALGGQTVDLLLGLIEDPSGTVEIFEWAGADQFAARIGPLRCQTSRLFALRYVNASAVSNATTFVANVLALRGTEITITDEFGTAHTHCLVQDVRHVPCRNQRAFQRVIFDGDDRYEIRMAVDVLKRVL